MKRTELVDILEGIHPRFGRGIAFLIQGTIVLSLCAIALNTMPDLSPGTRRALWIVESAALTVFVIEYILRVICSPRPLRYVLSFWGIVDLLACLPALGLIAGQWSAVRVFRLLRLLRLFKLTRTSNSLTRLWLAMVKVRSELMVFVGVALMLLYMASVGIYVFEHKAQPEAFSSIPASFWWAIATFTTVGYGDMFPVTTGGRIFTSLILFVGLGVVAVPTGIVTTALMEITEDDVAAAAADEPETNDGRQS